MVTKFLTLLALAAASLPGPRKGAIAVRKCQEALAPEGAVEATDGSQPHAEPSELLDTRIKSLTRLAISRGTAAVQDNGQRR